ncbi:hypothetical protein [Erwinia piriflorinigrans]|uniref:Uncharacterized protein n=1 Tax=Erwinia piriflorinigrans CFBP 5888 TaxID=1161919 RepID=V5Z531_9GAMM|nr:hypothetical protein [Erwinia piriflorinigrans]CCG86016.1 hypothetical protein EPIR_0651 [Erwinia piriflorinigrans CFBP 5888]
MNEKALIIMKMEKHIEAIKSFNDNKFEKSIFLHYHSISYSYSKNKLFYKTIFKNHRFVLSTILVIEFFTSSPPLLAEVKRKFMLLEMLSDNTVSNFLTFLKVSRRIKTRTLNDDHRKQSFVVTDKGLNETLNLIKTMVIPLDYLSPELSLKTRVEESNSLNDFFHNYSAIINNGLFDFECAANIDIFILKDAGHMILLNLYCNVEKKPHGNIVSVSLAEISAKCGVSRSHIKRIITEAELAGLLLFSMKKKEILLLPPFFRMTEEYMAYYFSKVLIGFDVEL